MANKSETEVPKQAGYRSETISEGFTKLLDRNVEVELFLPPGIGQQDQKYSLLLLNDG